MRPRNDGWSLVLAGFWNRLIFTPDWVIPRFFEGETEIGTKVSLLPVMPLIYEKDGLSMEVSSTRILFRPPNTHDDRQLLRVEEMARRALNDLPETPVQAMGINFAFEDEDPPG